MERKGGKAGKGAMTLGAITIDPPIDEEAARIHHGEIMAGAVGPRNTTGTHIRRTLAVAMVVAAAVAVEQQDTTLTGAGALTKGITMAVAVAVVAARRRITAGVAITAGVVDPQSMIDNVGTTVGAARR